MNPADTRRIRDCRDTEVHARNRYRILKAQTADAIAGAILDRGATEIDCAQAAEIPLARVEHMVATERALRKQKQSRILGVGKSK